MNVYVALSGGVDSAVSAALLRQQGHEVTGVFIRIYRPEFIECTWREDRLDAMRVCAALSIPYREVDFSEEYKREVVDAMIVDYRNGITPNPDVLCNRAIKFGSFFSWAKSQGADKIATGHYARIANSGHRYQLLRGIDSQKDQSYFLYRLTESDLEQTAFPVGELEKSEVRTLAKALGLPVAQKHDSQGVCFIGDVSMPDFLRRYIDIPRGAVHNINGETIGEHEGAAFFTLGQRHGFSISSSVEGGPQYVVGIHVETNTITVSPQRMDAAKEICKVGSLTWVSTPPKNGEVLAAQTRYRERAAPVSLEKLEDGRCLVRFVTPHIAPPGQSLVLYDKNTVVGGGVILK